MNKRSFSHPGSIENGSIDTEYSPRMYTSTDGSLRISAQDERFASVNEAIGLLQYGLEQHIAQDSATLADFISSSLAVMDEYGARIAALEAAQPIPQISRWPAAAHPPEGDWAHIPSAEWEDIKAELEGLRAYRATTQSKSWHARKLILILENIAENTPTAVGDYYRQRGIHIISAQDIATDARQWLADNWPEQEAEE